MSQVATFEQDVAPLAPAQARAPIAPVGRIDLPTMDFETMQRVGRVLVECEYYKDVRNVAQTVAKLMVGQELGLTIFETMTGIEFLEGKLEMKPALMASRISRSKEYRYVVERSDKDGEGIDNPRCVIAFYRKANGAEYPTELLLGRHEWSHEDTKRARLTAKDNWVKYGQAMRWARCMSAGTRAFCPDILGGGSIYVAGELEPWAVTPKVTSIAAAPSVVAAVATPPAPENAAAKAKMLAVATIAGDLHILPARMELDLEACDHDLDALLALYQEKKSAATPARGGVAPAAPAPAPVDVPTGAVSEEKPARAALTAGDAPQAIDPPAGGGGEPAARTLPNKVARVFANTNFAKKAERLGFAANVLGLDAVESFNDLDDDQLRLVEERLHYIMGETRKFNEAAAREAEQEAAKAPPGAASSAAAGKRIVQGPNACSACWVPAGQAHFSDCEAA